MNNNARYHDLTIAMHWATAIAIFVAVGSVLLREVVEDDNWQSLLIGLHRSMGVSILFLAVVRLLTRLVTNSSGVNAGLSKSVRIVAKAGHSALYFFLLAVPFAGWLLTSAQGEPLTLFGVYDLPALVSKNRDLADQLGDLHETGGWVFIALIGLHISAALWHHFWRKDQVLRSMLLDSPQ
ncbi:cytochrome b [Pseudomonas sp. CCI3.2]|uniref:cytochrome b n=1 Tax=unclassified Pseudomonas TaxID=196821 RepID=UPI002AC8D872|nr:MULTISPECIES: cytochrome b [unclassified Pseudomonas]MEB0076423.1 cytochrome b [Pseudomonas sp. MH10out]MEB0091228.1 cytochrome b [Pseudomonas sp. CCI4.2]MEB0100818.1 cytochrome b [Pseudomonas sp. CCI3.2]MEB0128797.1 cytochrome b [Pseudomonas sp. CCI2.4]MEB0156976.1 cytochrome b [Pseudomonas sp. AH2 (2023)]